MKLIQFAAGIGAAWLVTLAGPAEAYVVDWKSSYMDDLILSQTGGSNINTAITKVYDCSWNRSIQAWQSFKYDSDSRTMTAIALHLYAARAFTSISLRVYSGVGVGGLLLSSTVLEWDTDFDGGWYGFKLDMPVYLEKGQTYTFSLENLQAGNEVKNRNIVPVINDNPSLPNLSYMQQGYFGTGPGPRGYSIGSDKGAIDFKLIGRVLVKESKIPGDF